MEVAGANYQISMRENLPPAVTDPDLGSLSESGTCSFFPGLSPDVGSYKDWRLLPLRPVDSHPRPVRIIAVPLPRDMELDFQIDTSWCMGCSRQILPKRSYTPAPQPLPPQPPTRTS